MTSHANLVNLSPTNMTFTYNFIQLSQKCETLTAHLLCDVIYECYLNTPNNAELSYFCLKLFRVLQRRLTFVQILVALGQVIAKLS